MLPNFLHDTYHLELQLRKNVLNTELATEDAEERVSIEI